jgi:hypothetical protein
MFTLPVLSLVDLGFSTPRPLPAEAAGEFPTSTSRSRPNSASICLGRTNGSRGCASIRRSCHGPRCGFSTSRVTDLGQGLGRREPEILHDDLDRRRLSRHGHRTRGGQRDNQARASGLHVSLSAERIVLWGESLGSAVAIALAADKPVGRIVLEAPFTSAADVGALHYRFLPMRLFMKDQFRSDLRVRGILV